MKVIGRLGDQGIYRNGDEEHLLVSISVEEWELLRTLVSADADGAVNVDMKVAEAFRSFRFAAAKAAQALGLVPKE